MIKEPHSVATIINTCDIYERSLDWCLKNCLKNCVCGILTDFLHFKYFLKILEQSTNWIVTLYKMFQ